MKNRTAEARRLAITLKRKDVKVVFAESCTGGLVAATLAKVPGISEYLCGSAVTYRNDTKQRWLGISADTLSDPGPVSEIVAREMAEGVLAMTPEASWSASVTGHLGPNAPQPLDGLVYVGIAHRTKSQSAPVSVTASRHVLAVETRSQRQRKAASLVLRLLFDAIDSWQEEQ